MNEKENVLIVDDDIDIRSLYNYILNNAGYGIREATSGFECLEILEKENYPVILLDMMMPKMDGAKTLEEIQKKHPECIVIMVTAYSSVASAIELLTKGAFAYISKPINNTELIVNVKHAYERYNLILENKRLKGERNEIIDKNTGIRYINFILGIDSAENITNISKDLARLLEYDLDELIGLPFDKIFDSNYLENKLYDMITEGKIYSIDIKLITKSRKFLYTKYSGKIMFTEDKKPLEFIGQIIVDKIV